MPLRTTHPGAVGHLRRGEQGAGLGFGEDLSGGDTYSVSSKLCSHIRENLVWGQWTPMPLREANTEVPGTS